MNKVDTCIEHMRKKGLFSAVGVQRKLCSKNIVRGDVDNAIYRLKRDRLIEEVSGSGDTKYMFIDQSPISMGFKRFLSMELV